ncbi:methylamine utilization protein [Bizionia gelidisalsuginis]|uniref:Methylamine utilization protein n=1 Tax=Bizionia gelidisalsuginis TaxID=291188 RepID=A0ABY3MEN7_9FLAO|nr:cytochrome c peroxidase [Bizionia gelidisalsuginis]TYC18076.1 methylamine utilization protein [Bizionia gelidisalsuginis]
MITPIFKLKKTHTLGMCLLLIILSSCKQTSTTYEQQDPLVQLETQYKSNLNTCYLYLDSVNIATTKVGKLAYFIQSRNYFKRVEPILSFIDKNNYKSLNQPNILRVQEEDATDIKENAPFGFQVLEEQLHDDTISNQTITNTINFTRNRLGLIAQNTTVQLRDYHLLWLLRDAVIRVAVTGTTGFDSPILERSLEESIIVYKELKTIVELYKDSFSNLQLYNQWLREIESTLKGLATDFTSFNRYGFIKNHTHKQLELLVATQEDWGAEYPFQLAISNDATSLFSSSTFNMEYFSDYKQTTVYKAEKIALGKQLFNDKRLSTKQNLNCASCHHKDKAFTDGLPISANQSRNSPTLTYAALQQSFFYDGRAGSLEGQVAAVVKNEKEFHSDLETMRKAVENDTTYVAIFKKIYDNKIDGNTIRNAIASYIRSLNAFNSKFDNNINGVEHTITESEIRGFNLFMGKAKCATCHFAPVFNGTVPPNFTETEFEALGVPETTGAMAEISPDLGRYYLFNTDSRKHFFKTSTVRNVSLTAPYMHNGVYKTLDEVMTFYNNGGGSALGIQLEHQTLPSDALNLSDDEIKAIIDFMNSLEDLKV